MEGGNPVRAHRIARDRLICGGAPGYAADNTVRALRPGAGMRVGKSASAEELAAGVRQVLQEPEYARAARRYAADRAEALLGR